jgi:hypothetical protein
MMVTNSVHYNRISLRIGPLVALLFCLGIPMRLSAQVVGATLSGTVTDNSGGVVVGAEVTIKDVSTDIVRTVLTNTDGFYSAANLLPDNYIVSVSAAGFSTETANVTLTVGAKQVLNRTLQVGSQTQAIEVAGGEAMTMNLTDAVIGALVEEDTVHELPLNGRSWSDLAALQPGVNQIRAIVNVSNTDRWSRGYGTQLDISGGRPEQNNYRLDGISINDPQNGGPGSVMGGNMGVDAISEFSVLTTNYSTEYGRASGGIINAITKSGTNAFHGSAYEFLRNSALDARNYFDPATIPPFRRNQFGVSGGGPIRKGSTFIFADYEGLRQYLSNSQVDTVPTTAARAGILTTPPAFPYSNGGPPLPANFACPAGTSLPMPGVSNTCVAPQAVRYLNAFFPLPNNQVFGDTGFYNFSNPSISTENYFTVRGDHKFSSKDTLSGTYYQDGSHVVNADEYGAKTFLIQVDRHFATLEETHIFGSNTVNDFRAGWNEVIDGAPITTTALKPVISDTTFGFIPGEPVGGITIGGITPFSGGVSTTHPASSESHHWNAYQIYDDILLTKGVHSIKFGFSVERDQLTFAVHDQSGGAFAFNTLSDFLTNQPQQLTLALTGVNGLTESQGAAPHMRQSIFGFYFQDDVRVRHNLTLNLGLRYEPASVASEKNGLVVNQVDLTAVLPQFGNPLYHNNSLRDFDPRVGFAWDPFGTGKTSVRGGFGIYDNLLLLAYWEHAGTFWPYIQGGRENNSAATPLVNSFPGGIALGSVTLNPDQKGIEHWDNNPGRSYVMQWNTSIEREITPTLSVLIGYVGTHGVHGGVVHDDVGETLPMYVPTNGPGLVDQYLWPCEPFVPAGSPLGPPFGCQGAFSGPRSALHSSRLRSVNFKNSSLYDGLEVQVTKKMSHGFQVGGSFTWSKSIDLASGAVFGDQYLNGISTGLDTLNPGLTRGLSDYNVPRSLTINYLWDLPVPKFARGGAAAFLGGWELGGILTLTDGTPFTAFIAGDPTGSNSNDPLGYPDRLTGPGCASLVNPGNVTNYIKLQCFVLPPADVVNGVHYLRKGNLGRNALAGPGVENFDFSVIKNTHVKRISEAFNVQFRAELFNVFNRPNFLPPTANETIYDPTIPGLGISPADLTASIIPGAGAINATSTTSRQVQFGLKLIW